MLALSEGLRQTICGDGITLHGERMMGRSEEGGLNCTDRLSVADFRCVGGPADATGARLNIGAQVLETRDSLRNGRSDSPEIHLRR